MIAGGVNFLPEGVSLVPEEYLGSLGSFPDGCIFPVVYLFLNSFFIVLQWFSSSSPKVFYVVKGQL